MTNIAGRAAAPFHPSSEAGEQSFRYMATATVAVGVLVVTFNALRPFSGATLADLLFLVGAGLLALHLLSKSALFPRVPLWLVGSAFCILALGLLSALFAPPVVMRGLPNRYGSSVTLPFSTDFSANIVAAVRFSGTVLLVPLLIGLVSNTRARVERIVDLWLASAVISGLVALSDAFQLTSIGEQLTGIAFGQLGREPGLTLHPNHLATVAAMALPVAFSRATTARSSLRRWLSWMSVALIAAALGASGARAGLVAGAIGVLLVLLLQRQERGRMVVGVAIAGAAAVLLVSAGGSDSLDKVSVGLERLIGGGDASSTNVEASNAARRASYDSAVRTIAQHPIAGTGFESVRDAHDLYLQLLQGGGVFLLCAFGVFAVGALRLGHRLSRDFRLTADMQSLSGALMISMAVWLIAGLVQNPLYDRYLYLPIGLLLSLHFLAHRNLGQASPVAEATVVQARASQP